MPAGCDPTAICHETIFAQIAADALQIDVADVTVEHGDSAVVPRGVGTFGSRSTTIGGSALVVTLEKIKSRVVQIAAHILEAAPADIMWNDGRLHVPPTPRTVRLFSDHSRSTHPRAEWMPPVESALMETPSPLNPLGAKGIGEAGTIGTPAAVANAVMDALAPYGVHHVDFPLTPQRIWQAIRAVDRTPRGRP